MKDNYKLIAHKKIKIEGLDEQIKSLIDEKGKEKLKDMLEAHTQKQIYRLEIETGQEKERSDNFFESIKYIEQETNNCRNKYVVECNEKDELKSG